MKKILDIFSKTKSKTKTKKKQPLPTIIIDNREKSSLVPSELSSLGFKIEYKQLPVADYLVGPMAFERKTVQDLKTSIINKRIFSQISEIRQYPNHALIIEGPQEDLYNSMTLHENAVRGFILSAQLDYKIPIIFSKNTKETANLIALFAKKSKKEISIRPSKTMRSKKEQQQFILEGFPAIGPKTAKALLKEFKTLSRIFNASEEELEKVLKKRAKDFKTLLS